MHTYNVHLSTIINILQATNLADTIEIMPNVNSTKGKPILLVSFEDYSKIVESIKTPEANFATTKE